MRARLSPPGPAGPTPTGPARDPGAAGQAGVSGSRPGDAFPGRGRITARGVVERITVAPVRAAPTFTVLARIDGQGTQRDIRIIWMGQRRVPGIQAGVTIAFEGMLTRVDNIPTVYNPRYEIIGRPEENE